MSHNVRRNNFRLENNGVLKYQPNLKDTLLFLESFAYIPPCIGLNLRAGLRAFTVVPNTDHCLPVFVHVRGQVC